MFPRGLRRGQVKFLSHNSYLSVGASPPGRCSSCVLSRISFRGGYSPTGLPGDTVWLAFSTTGWGGLSALSLWGQRRLSKSSPFKVKGLVLAVVRYYRRFQQPPCRRVAPCSPPARRPRVALRVESAHPRHALCSLGMIFWRSLWPLCLRQPVVSIDPPQLRAFWSGVGRLVKRREDCKNKEAGGRAAPAAVFLACDVRTVAADVRSRLQRLLCAGVVAGSSRRLVDMLSSVAVHAAQNPRVNAHLHLTGHDKNGNTF